MGTRENLLDRLDATVRELLDLYRTMSDPEGVVHESWSAKDVLGHITFWHESFARNVEDIANGNKPSPLKGKLNDLNQRSVDEMSTYTVETILRRLIVAQQTIRNNILNPRLTLVPYRKGSRDYSPEEHLDIVNKHISEHMKAVRAACERAGKHQTHPYIR